MGRQGQCGDVNSTTRRERTGGDARRCAGTGVSGEEALRSWCTAAATRSAGLDPGEASCRLRSHAEGDSREPREEPGEKCNVEAGEAGETAACKTWGREEMGKGRKAAP